MKHPLGRLYEPTAQWFPCTHCVSFLKIPAAALATNWSSILRRRDRLEAVPRKDMPDLKQAQYCLHTCDCTGKLQCSLQPRLHLDVISMNSCNEPLSRKMPVVGLLLFASIIYKR